MRALCFVLAAAVAAAQAGCRRREAPEPARLSPEEARRLLDEIGARESAKPAAGARASPAGPSTAPAEDEPDAGSARGKSMTTRPPEELPFIVDEPVDIAKAAPIAARPEGVYLMNRAAEVALARLGPLPRLPRSTRTPIRRVPASAGPFPLGRGPTVLRDHAYWITAGNLVRRRLPTGGNPAGPLEVLAEDAQDGARVGAPVGAVTRNPANIPATVAYVVRPDDEESPTLAKIWVEGGATRVLTPEGTSTHSASLVLTETGVLAISVTARMAITPIHARSVRFARREPLLGEDVVVWVGGGVQRMTELTLLPLPDGRLWGFLPHERSITEFGVAWLDIGAEPDMNTPVEWMIYPNGIDPAPLAAGAPCGKPAILYAQPTAEDPDSPQELVIRPLTRGEPSAGYRLATARGFFDVSVSDLPGGALVAYVADARSRALTLRCKTPRK